MAVKQEKTPSFIDSIQGEVAAEASPMLQFLIDNTRYIVLGIVLFIAVIIGYWFYSSNAQSVKAEQQMEFGRLVAGKTGSERIAALEEYLKTAPESLHTQAWFAIAEAASAEGDFEKSYQAWEAISKKDPAIKVTAAMAMAQAREQQGKDEEALKLLEGVAGQGHPADIYNVNSRIAILAENLGNYPRAITACEAIIALPSASDGAVVWQQKINALQKKMASAETTGESAPAGE